MGSPNPGVELCPGAEDHGFAPMLATLLRPTSGAARVCGFDVRESTADVRRRIGYMPDFFGVYDDMTVMEYLDFFASAYRIPVHKRRAICEEKLELVDMTFKRDAYASQLSRGQTQRIGLARVLLRHG